MSVRQFFTLVAVCLGLTFCISLAAMALYPSVTAFRGHTGRILSAVASPDGKTLASVSDDETIKLWDLSTHKERFTLRGRYAAFGFDGKTLASTDKSGGTIEVWDAATGEERAILRGHTSTVACFALSPDGKLAASGGSDKTVTLWDAVAGKVKSRHQGHSQAVNAVMFSPDGKTLASVGRDLIELWDVTANKEGATLRGSAGSFSLGFCCVAFSPDGKTLASGNGITIMLWDVAAGTNIATLNPDEVEMASVVFSPDGKTLASLDDYDTINLWDTASGENVATSEKDRSGPPRPRLLRYLWNILPDSNEKKRDVPLSVFFNSDGRLMAAGRDANDDTTVKVWKAAVSKRKK